LAKMRQRDAWHIGKVVMQLFILPLREEDEVIKKEENQKRGEGDEQVFPEEEFKHGVSDKQKCKYQQQWEQFIFLHGRGGIGDAEFMSEQ